MKSQQGLRARDMSALGRVAAVALFALSTSACRRATPAGPPPIPVALKTIGDARPRLLASVCVSDPAELLESGGEWLEELGLKPLLERFADAPVLTSGVTSELWALVDHSSPLGLAVLPGDGLTPETYVLAASRATSAQAAATLSSAAKVVERRGDAVLLESKVDPARRFWALLRDDSFVVSPTWDGLLWGANAALAARRCEGRDAAVTFFPHAIARAMGGDVSLAVNAGRGWLAGLAPAIRSQLSRQPAEMQMFVERLLRDSGDSLIGFLGDVDGLELGATFEDDEGVRLHVAITPTPRSGLARALSTHTSVQIDSALLAEPLPTALWASGSGALAEHAQHLARELLFRSRKDKKAADAFDLLTRSLAGPWATAARPASGPEPVQDVIYALVPGVRAQALQDAVTTLVSSDVGRSWFALLAPGMRLTAQCRGDSLLVTAARAGAGTKITRAAHGSAPHPFEAAFAVDRDRLLVALGPASESRLDRLRRMPAGGAVTHGHLAEALSDGQGSDGLFFTDLAAARSALLRADRGSNPSRAWMNEALSSGSVPVYGSYRLGGSLSVDVMLTKPVLAATAALVRSRTAQSGKEND